MQSLRRIAVLVAVSAAFAPSLAAPPPAVAAEIIVVPPGNRSDKQPKVYSGSKFLTAVRNSGSFNDKYKRVYAVFANNPKLGVAAEFDTGEQYGMAVKKDGNVNLLRTVNDVLADLRTNGGYQKIYEKWFGSAPSA